MAGLNLSEYVRRSSLNQKIYISNMDAVRELTYEINKIGVNINQVVKLCNESKMVSRQSMEKLNNWLDDVQVLLAEAVQVMRFSEAQVYCL